MGKGAFDSIGNLILLVVLLLVLIMVFFRVFSG
jgi:hypothetical protein